MKAVGLFVDTANLYYCVNKKYPGRKIDYLKYYTLNTDGDIVVRAVAYGSQIGVEATKFITCLKHYGYDTRFRRLRINNDTNKPKKASWNVGIAVDALKSIDKLDQVILGSSDPDLLPLVEYIKETGRVVKIIACGISKELKEAAHSFIDIDEQYLEDLPQLD